MVAAFNLMLSLQINPGCTRRPGYMHERYDELGGKSKKNESDVSIGLGSYM